jgi:hypothetical protein
MALREIILISALALAQAPAPVRPILIGSNANSLSDLDIADLEKLAGGHPWLINARKSQQSSGVIEQYLPPVTATSELRRGKVVSVAGKAVVREDYAQVAIAGRAFDQIKDDTDPNRPFQVSGLDDRELLNLVRFIRSRPSSPVSNVAGRPGLVEGALPITRIERVTEAEADRVKVGQIRVTLRTGDFTGQEVVLERRGDSWAVISAMHWQA